MGAAAVIYVGDVGRMRAFYEECFDLTTVDEEAGYADLESAAWSLTLVRSPAALPATAPPPRRSDTPVKLAFAVASIDAVRATAARLGGRVDAEDGEWSFGRTVRCDVIDPEGNVVQLIQSAGG